MKTLFLLALQLSNAYLLAILVSVTRHSKHVPIKLK